MNENVKDIIRYINNDIVLVYEKYGDIIHPTVFAHILISGGTSTMLDSADSELDGMKMVHNSVKRGIEYYEKNFS